MGLFDVFKKKEKPDEVPRSAEERGLMDYSGMRVEVHDRQGHMLFMAKIQIRRGGEAELSQYSETELSQETEPIPVRIRGYSDHERKAVYLEGTIVPQPKHTWQVTGLKLERIDNDRAFFRLDTDLNAELTVLSGLGAGDRPCKLVNISIGGACVNTDQVFHKDDKFLLKAKLQADRPVSLMYCQVLRVTDKDRGRFEYGCRFLELTEADQEQISKNIFDFQRQKRSGGIRN